MLSKLLEFGTSDEKLLRVMVDSAKLSVKVLIGTMAVLVLIGMEVEELAAVVVFLLDVLLAVVPVLVGALLDALVESLVVDALVELLVVDALVE